MRCHQSAGPVSGKELVAECKSAGAHDMLRISQVVWASADARQ